MASLADTLAQLDGKAILTAEDALAVRRIVFGGDLAVSSDEACALVRLNTDAGAISPEWSMLYIEVLTDYVVRQQQPCGYVDPAKADWLLAAVSRDGCAKDDEVEILIRVLEQAEQTPAAFAALVLDTLKSQILARCDMPGLTAQDVESLRRVVFAAGGDHNIGVTRREAEGLFDLNDAVRGYANTPAWTDFFVRAVANAVLYEASYHAPDIQAELRREAWMADTAIHPFSFLKGWAHGEVSLRSIEAPDVRQAWRAGLAADDALEAAAQQITAEEAHWLTERVGRDGVFDVNERALIAFLAANAGKIDASLQPLIRRLAEHPALRSAEAETASPPAFGHRKLAPTAS